MLEALAAKLFVENATEAQKRKLKKAFTDIDVSAAAGNAAKLFAAGTRYYEIMLEGAKNDALQHTVRNLNWLVTQLRRVSLACAERLPATRAEMAAIQTAIDADDGEGAFEASRAHIESAQRLLVSALAEQAKNIIIAAPEW